MTSQPKDPSQDGHKKDHQPVNQQQHGLQPRQMGRNMGRSMERNMNRFESQSQQAASGKGGLDKTVQAKMENAFQSDFSDVNITQNSGEATNMGALAFTQGNNIHFAPGQYKPTTSEGQELIGHELTHVIQQKEGRVKANTQAKGVAVNDDPALESEADLMGKKAANGQHVIVQKKSALSVQKQQAQFPWSELLSAKGRDGLNSYIHARIASIKDRKMLAAEVWKDNADIQDFMPGAFALEVALTVLGAALGGAMGSVAGNAISKVAGEIATDAATDALKKLYEVGYDNMKKVLTASSQDLRGNAVGGLSATVDTGLKNYYVASVKSMFLSERESADDEYTNDFNSMTDEELAIMAYTLNESLNQIVGDASSIMQQLTIGYIKLQDVLYINSHANISGDSESATNKEKIRDFYKSDGDITETATRSGQLLITGPLGGIGNYNSPRISISNAIATNINQSTYRHLTGAKIKDLPFSVSFRFWGSTPNHDVIDALTLESSLCRVWFVKDGNGAIWIDMDESGQRESNGYDQGREWLARHYLDTSRELTMEEITQNAPQGARKLYDAIKDRPLNSIIDLDLF